MCQEIFDLHFYHDSNPSRPLISRLKYLQIRFRFRRDIQIFKKLRSVHHLAESNSAVCITPQSQVIKSFKKTLQCASHHGVSLSGVLPTEELSRRNWNRIRKYCTLACLSGAQIGSNQEKNGGWKSRDTLLLNTAHGFFGFFARYAKLLWDLRLKSKHLAISFFTF